MNDDLDPLMVNVGDEIRAEDHNKTVRAIRVREFRSGPGVRIRRLDTHSVISYYGSGRTVIAHAWKPRSKYTAEGKPGVLFSRGLVNGIEPVIGEKKISDDQCEPLEIPEYNDAGDCLIYVELKLHLQSWAIERAAMVAYAVRPEGKPFTARKLIAVAEVSGRIVPRAHFDFGFDSSQRRPNGTFKPWWRALG